MMALMKGEPAQRKEKHMSFTTQSNIKLHINVCFNTDLIIVSIKLIFFKYQQLVKGAAIRDMITGSHQVHGHWTAFKNIPV